MNLFTKQKQTHRLIENELMIAKEEGWGWGDSQGVWDGHVHTAIFKMDDQKGPNVQHRKQCLMLHGSLDGMGAWGRMDTCICMAEFLCCPPETITTLLTSYTPV